VYQTTFLKEARVAQYCKMELNILEKVLFLCKTFCGDYEYLKWVENTRFCLRDSNASFFFLFKPHIQNAALQDRESSNFLIMAYQLTSTASLSGRGLSNNFWNKGSKFF
jgi:hypothetical protein